MHALIVVAHPDPKSLTHGVAAQSPKASRFRCRPFLEIADLAAEGFDPRFIAGRFRRSIAGKRRFRRCRRRAGADRSRRCAGPGLPGLLVVHARADERMDRPGVHKWLGLRLRCGRQAGEEAWPSDGPSGRPSAALMRTLRGTVISADENANRPWDLRLLRRPGRDIRGAVRSRTRTMRPLIWRLRTSSAAGFLMPPGNARRPTPPDYARRRDRATLVLVRSARDLEGQWPVSA